MVSPHSAWPLWIRAPPVALHSFIHFSQHQTSVSARFNETIQRNRLTRPVVSLWLVACEPRLSNCFALAAASAGCPAPRENPNRFSGLSNDRTIPLNNNAALSNCKQRCLRESEL